MAAPGPFVSAFAQIYQKCLALKPGEDLLVVYDESFDEFLDACVSAAVACGHFPTLLYVPSSLQRSYCTAALRSSDEARLPAPIEDATSAAHAILNVVNGSDLTLGFRKALLRIMRRHECRFAHVPGIDGEVLDLVARSPFDEIEHRAELLAWALGRATNTVLITHDPSGNCYELLMDLGGWKNEPLMSSGLLQPGSWGNLPPGETFCCPSPAQVSGQVCITGSVPDLVLAENDAVVLTFQSGRLVSWQGQPGSAGVGFFDAARDRAKADGDDGWNLFAELGIGLNPAIPALTGNALYDEKVAGTVHVAIGENTYFGHDNKSNLHADLAIVGPELRCGDITIVRGGHLLHVELEEVRRNAKPLRWSLDSGRRIRLRQADVVIDGTGVFRKLKKKGRSGRVRMSPPAFEEALRKTVQALDGLGYTSPPDLTSVGSDLTSEELSTGLAFLAEYNCLDIR